VFAGFEDSLDAVVAENGAVLVTSVGVRRLAAPVDRAVSAALSARGVVHRSGMVLVACAAADESVALEVVRGLGLDCQLVRNRGELMILPAGVTKGSGLREALGDLGLSHHNTIGVRRQQGRQRLVGTLVPRGLRCVVWHPRQRPAGLPREVPWGAAPVGGVHGDASPASFDRFARGREPPAVTERSNPFGAGIRN
jgi:hypothetical protein